jgi:HK97 family phage prohead protease
LERKSVTFELKDIDKAKRTAIIAHAFYNNIDLTDDISRKGMFNKSWSENKDDISFYLNHDDNLAPGKVTDVYEDDNRAYTKTWLGTHTLGNDVLIMMDEGIIKKASFGYYVEKKDYISVKGKRVRELKEVRHIETSVLTKQPANPKAGVMSVVKALGGARELKEFVGEFEDHIKVMEKFCRNTKASDDAIKGVLAEIENTKQFISEYNTVFTQERSPKPETSVDEKVLFDSMITNFIQKLN